MATANESLNISTISIIDGLLSSVTVLRDKYDNSYSPGLLGLVVGLTHTPKMSTKYGNC